MRTKEKKNRKKKKERNEQTKKTRHRIFCNLLKLNPSVQV